MSDLFGYYLSFFLSRDVSAPITGLKQALDCKTTDLSGVKLKLVLIINN